MHVCSFHISFSNLHKPVFTTMTNSIISNMLDSLPEQLKNDEHYVELIVKDLKNDEIPSYIKASNIIEG